MRQGREKPSFKKNLKDSRVTEVFRYSDFLAPRFWLTWLNIGFIYLLAWTPWFLKKALARGLAWLLLRVLKKRSHVLKTNIRLCFPEKTPAEQDQLIFDAMFSNVLGFFETAYAWCRDVRKVPLEFKGMEHYQKAQAEGKGVILLTCHFSPLDLGAALTGIHIKSGTVYRKHDNPLFNYFMTRSREQFFSYTVARKDVKGMFKHLQDGDTLCYLPDQDFGPKHSIFVPFFGVETATITMTSKLAEAGQAVVLPLSGYRKGDDFDYVLEVHAPLNIPSGDERADAIAWTQWLESCLRQHPDQYLWLHKRFKTRPEGEASVYNRKK